MDAPSDRESIVKMRKGIVFFHIILVMENELLKNDVKKSIGSFLNVHKLRNQKHAA